MNDFYSTQVAARVADDTDNLLADTLKAHLQKEWDSVPARDLFRLLASQMTRTTHGDSGIEEYSIFGKTFLRLHPLEIRNVMDGNSYRIQTSRKYEVLGNAS